jgi:tetratricopeptide (TPR) repeat protein
VQAADDVAENEREERQFRVDNAAEGPDSPVNRLTNMLLINALKRGASHLRVRDGEGGGVEERHGRNWRDEGPRVTPRLWTHVIWRLKEMAGVAPGTVAMCGSRVRLALGKAEGPPEPCDFDVTFARTPTGAAIVLGVVPMTVVVAPSVDPAEEVAAQLALGSELEAQERLEDAQAHFELAVTAAEAFGPENGLVVVALSSAGRGCVRRGDVPRAERLLERAQAVADVLVGADSALLMPRLELARARRTRDASAAATSTREVLALAESFGDDWMTEQALGDLAELELARGELEPASELLRRALALAGSHPRALRLQAMLALAERSSPYR